MVLGMWFSKDFTLGKLIYYNDKKELKTKLWKRFKGTTTYELY
jgi:hypothetical protein